MAKQRALTVTATATQTVVDTDGTTKLKNTQNFTFLLEQFISSSFAVINPELSGKKAGRYQDIYYKTSVNTWTETWAESWAVVKDFLRHFPTSASGSVDCSRYQGNTNVINYEWTGFSDSYVPNGVTYSPLDFKSIMVDNGTGSAALRYIILSLSDDEYNNIVEVWKEKCTQFIKDTIADSTAVITFTNEPVTE